MLTTYKTYDARSSPNRTPRTIFSLHTEAMSEANNRLREARLKAGFKTAKDAALKWRVNANTLTSHENGNRPLSREAAVLYAAKLGVTPGWLLYGEVGQPDGGDEETAAVLAAYKGLDPDARALVRALMQQLRVLKTPSLDG